MALSAQAQHALDNAQDCAAQVSLQMQEVVAGVTVVHGRWPTTENADPDLVGAEPVVSTVVLGQGRERTVVDPGPHQHAGLALRKVLACQHFAQVTGLINTHAHAEQVLANAAFAAPVMALRGTANAMRQRCADCLASLTQTLGVQAMQGSKIVLPGVILQEGQWLEAGGRQWQVRDMQQAHTENDLVLWSPSVISVDRLSMQGGIVIAGGLVDGRWPVLAQGSILGWLRALDQLSLMQPDWLIGQHLVVGHEHVQQVLGRQHDYLCNILRFAWVHLEQGKSEQEVMPDLILPKQWPVPLWQQRQAWQRQHMFNQRRAWREAEQLWLDQRPWTSHCGSAPNIGR